MCWFQPWYYEEERIDPHRQQILFQNGGYTSVAMHIFFVVVKSDFPTRELAE